MHDGESRQYWRNHRKGRVDLALVATLLVLGALCLLVAHRIWGG